MANKVAIREARNILSTKQAACRTGTKPSRLPVSIFLMPGFSVNDPPAEVSRDLDKFVRGLTKADISSILQELEE